MPPFIEMRREIYENQPPNDEDSTTAEVAEDVQYDILKNEGNDAENVAEMSAEDKLAAEMEELKDELKEKDSSLKRLRADFENFRRRTAKEKEELSDFVVQNVLKDMLPLVDNFGRAMTADRTDVEAFAKGLEMIHNQFLDVLKNHGLKEIVIDDATTFDPNFHQAVMRVANPDLPDGVIAQELQKGYMVKDRVIRPSMVQVVGN